MLWHTNVKLGRQSSRSCVAENEKRKMLKQTEKLDEGQVPGGKDLKNRWKEGARREEGV